jgi:hypothetical protein
MGRNWYDFLDLGLVKSGQSCLEEKRMKLVVLALFMVMPYSPALASGGVLGSSYEEVEKMLGKPSRHDHGKLLDVAYDRYHFETGGWKTAVLFIEGKAQKFETEKSDGSPLSEGEKRAILDGYDLPDREQNAKVRGWRPLSENHLIRGDGRMHAITHPNSMTLFLDDLARDFW